MRSKLGWPAPFVAAAVVLLSGPAVSAQQPEKPLAPPSIEALQKRAQAGDREAQADLGDAYRLGTIAPHDYNKAIGWYTKAAKQGLPRAQHALGDYYCSMYEIDLGDLIPGNTVSPAGRTVSTDELAKSWYRKAADQGYAESMFMLAVLNSGRWAAAIGGTFIVNGVFMPYPPVWAWRQDERPVDAAEAGRWYILAAQFAPQETIRDYERARDEFQQLLNADQVRKAQKLAQDWLTGYRKKHKRIGAAIS